MNQLILNGKELREALNISTTLFYKFLKNGMPYHQISGGRKYYILDEVTDWLTKAGYHQEKIWSK